MLSCVKFECCGEGCLRRKSDPDVSVVAGAVFVGRLEKHMRLGR